MDRNHKVKTQKEQTNPFYDRAFEYLKKDKSKEAFSQFDKAKDLFLLQRDSLGVGKCLLNMAIISTNNGDFFGGQEISLNASSYFDKKIKEHDIYNKSNLNNLGFATENLKDYSQAIVFYTEALDYISGKIPETILKNNIANVYRKRGAYQKAIEIYQNLLKQQTNKNISAKILSNLALTKWLQNSNYQAAPQLLKALEMRKEDNDLLGLNASYAHLADYYTIKMPDSALFYAIMRYQNSKVINSVDDRLEALQKLIKLSPPEETKHYFQTYQALDDSIRTVRVAAKNQFAVIRYQTEKQKADNITLQKENGDKKYQIIIISSVALFILVSGIFWYRKRKRDIETQSQKAITESKLKTSKKVHDVVANGLYRVMTEIENQHDLDRNHVLDKIEDLYEKSRDISYEKPMEVNKPFHERLSELLTSFATETRKVLIAGNDAELWLKVSEQTKYEIEHIIQELMVNMKKHSQASNVAMRFENNGEQIKIYYTDNGVGMPKGKQFNNGLRNTGNRIEEINGAIIFDTEVEKGLKIQILFPIS
ncbi:tetratricopeptide repeat protein [Pedobacter petrophilus]|uniref:Tetratricopeptide repeat protein n=1 Tax=Pedobacter petrophilus TaxID=1908241 RepID=A0A7K0FYY5_9SPHI|nr:tetratricopeptide repeat-containing sensor histidine kinase [Pedobacter petrophilus]MRX76778.1 tetratricopeptide repeat protein [Pedobacter petrophilus]